jgi:hypothetical protein
MENLIALVLVIPFLGGILWFARRFVKPVKEPLPDCCSGKGNRNIQV